MLKRAYRLRKNTEFQKIYKKGRRFSTDNFTLYYLESFLDYSQFGFVISKKVSKKSVVRNRLRRRAAAIIDTKYKDLKRPYKATIVIRRDFSGLKPEQIQKEMTHLIKVITK